MNTLFWSANVLFCDANALFYHVNALFEDDATTILPGPSVPDNCAWIRVSGSVDVVCVAGSC